MRIGNEKDPDESGPESRERCGELQRNALGCEFAETIGDNLLVFPRFFFRVFERDIVQLANLHATINLTFTQGVVISDFDVNRKDAVLLHDRFPSIVSVQKYTIKPTTEMVGSSCTLIKAQTSPAQCLLPHASS